MENNLQIFENDNFGQLRTIDDNDNGKVMFVASDVAKMLGYTNASKAISDHCRYVTKRYIPHPQGKGTLEVNIIPEGDLYRLITHSKLPAAEKFESWVFDEVLPTIRKHGNYAAPKQENKSKSIDLEIRLNNSKARMASEFRRIAEMTDIAEYKHICQQKAVEVLAGMPLLPMEEVTEKTYSATDIGKMFGVSKNKIGSLANANNLKTAEYGKLFYDKSPHSQKQVETFRYYECAVEKFRELLKGGEQE